MGAVFALYSAWYFWIPKILGVDYNKSLSKTHFWTLFAGVNITFFPQHFLGLQGMPRRISDYPDAFAGWNMVSSLGSLISVIATWLFLHILYVQLVEGKATSRYLWLTPQFYFDLIQTLLSRVFNSLEWGLNSPPKPHAFTSLPLQSRFSIKNNICNITISKIVGGIISVTFLFTARYLFYKYTDTVLTPLHIYEGLSLAYLTWFIKLIFQELAQKHLAPLGVDYTIEQLFYGLDKPKQGFSCNADRDNNTPKAGPSRHPTSEKPESRELVPTNAAGSQPQVAPVKREFSPSNSTSPKPEISNTHSLPEPRLESPSAKRLKLEAERNPSVPSNTGQSSSTGATASQTNVTPPVTNQGSGNNTSVMDLTRMPSNREIGPNSSGPSSSPWVTPGKYEETDAGWSSRGTNVDLQDLPVVPTQYHSTTTTLTPGTLLEKFPGHEAGRGTGFGHFGGNHSRHLHGFLDNDDYEGISRFVRDAPIPPLKGEPMISYNTNFWIKLWNKYLGSDVDQTSAGWPVLHKAPSALSAGTANNDTLISFKTTEGGTRDELKANCIEVMTTMQNLLQLEENHPDNEDGGLEYWKFFHEYMAARHYYQVFLLDDNTL